MESKNLHRLAPAADLVRALEEAGEISEGVGQDVMTTHVLLALYTVSNPAEILLRERDIDENRLIACLKKDELEKSSALRKLLRSAEETAKRCDAKSINTLHLLAAVLRERSCIAHRLLTSSLDSVPSFRNLVMSHITGSLPRRLQATIDAGPPSVLSLRARKNRQLPRRLFQDTNDDWVVPGDTFVGPAESSATFSSEDASVDDEDIRAASVRTPLPSSIPQRAAPSAAALPTAGRFAPVSRAPTLLPTAYDLDPSKFPWLTSLGRNLSSLAEHHQLDPTIGRGDEITQIIDVLGKRRANNPCLVGEPGVGKTAIAEGLAIKLVQGHRDVLSLRGKVIIELDMGRITAGTALRGSFSERMQGLKKDVERARGRVIIFIDEIHTLMGAGGSQDSPQDAANELKAALARGAFPCIGSTTLDEYRKFIATDPALERRFVRIPIDEPTCAETLEILEGASNLYEEYHGVSVEDSALHAAVQLSSQFIHDRRLPGKALDLLDLTMSRAKRFGENCVSRESVAHVCADIAKIPIDRVLLEDRERYLHMEDFIQQQVIGHSEIVATVCDDIRRNYAGFASQRPLANFMFLGPSGVGKTELAKSLADFLYGTEDALIRIDMSEFSERHMVSRLIGSPPGYVGHDAGGQLTEAIQRRPHAVVLLDEIEKAHADVLPLLLQVLDEGRLTDSKGKTVTFRHAVVIMTSNLGVNIKKPSARVGFGAAKTAPSFDEDELLKNAQKKFAPELWGRIEQKCVFHPLDEEQMTAIGSLMVDASLRTLAENKSIEIEYDVSLIAHLISQDDFDPQSGARPMRRVVQRLVERPISEAILTGDVAEGDAAQLVLHEGEIFVEVL